MKVGPEAADLLAALHEACFPPVERWDAGAMRSLLAMPGCFGWVAREGGLPCGLALVRVAADEAELLTLGVGPPARRAGHAAALLRAVSGEAATLGARRLFLEVAADNAPANALYRSQAFEEVGRRKAYYANAQDALILTRPLK